MLDQPAGTQRRCRPVVHDLLADLETPLSAYCKLALHEPVSFLFESVTGGENLARYSILGVRPRAILRSKGQEVRYTADGQTTVARLKNGEDPLHWLERNGLSITSQDAEGLPRLAGGWVGMIGYDYVRFVERLPDANPDPLDLDDIAMMLMESMVIFDHAKARIRILALADDTDEGKKRANAEIARIESIIRSPLPELPDSPGVDPPAMESNLSQAEYEAIVARCVEYMNAGDGVQVVPSLRLSGEFQSHPLTLYRALRSLNPSPFMFLVRFGDFDVVGASPELLVSLSGRNARVRPIAGTRPRGATETEDQQLSAELLSNEKERAEHVMLVDLGRNDLGRVCEFGSVGVPELMVIERYSHVLHIVSEVTGTLRAELNGYDMVRATFPAGTLSGAPKVRAMEIIDEVEPSRRGLYGGAVGYFSATGDVDLAIAIRTVLIKDGVAHVQVGAGVVADSEPTLEYEECFRKAGAPLRALELAHRGLES
ncbi:MAG: anthranilate synthase component I [Fimbriimonadaceae bacterium]|nr:anthranilate synthase component I [Fimbriimonadaceae bacterium]